MGKGRGMEAYLAGMTSLRNSRDETGKMSGGGKHIYWTFIYSLPGSMVDAFIYAF